MTETVLQLDKVALTLNAQSGPVKILRDIDLVAHAGETVSIVGPSGSGKSSLLAVSAGLERVTGGQVRLLDQDITAMSEAGLARLRRGRVGFVFQSFHLMPAMNALENVMSALEIAGLSDARSKAEAALDRVGLSHRLTHYPAQMSGGERQRVALARALSIDPEIVFADEPTGNLDGQASQSVVDMLFETLPQTGAALVLVTHDLDLAARAERTISMKDGRIEPDRTAA